jgi:hypothetical protein
MKLEELIKEWEVDGKLNRIDLIGDSLNTPKLHAKYWRIYMGERAKLIVWMNEFKALRLEKYEFYTQGPHSETPEGWELPASGKIIKADVERYLDSDKHLLDLGQKVDLQKEKIKMLESILHHLNTRNFIIKNAIEMIKFESGAN